MSTRAAAMEATHDRIVEAACEALVEGWYDEVTLRDVAARAGVALQTVVNHFGTKEALIAMAAERLGDRVASNRWTAKQGDIQGALTILVDEYDELGDHMIRTLALEGRVSLVAAQISRGRRGHEEWVEHVFAAALAGLRGAERRRRLAQLVVATDVFTWKLLRRDKGLSRNQTITAIRELVEALHHRPGKGRS